MQELQLHPDIRPENGEPMLTEKVWSVQWSKKFNYEVL
jgi:hypothetical protein